VGVLIEKAAGGPVDSETIPVTPTPIGAHVRRAANQSIPNLGLPAIIFDVIEYDQGGCFNPLFPTRLTAPVAGKYLITGSVNWLASILGVLRRAEIQESGVRDWALDDKTPVLGGVIGTTNLVSVEIALAAGQFVELKVQQDTGGPLDVEGGVRYSPSLSIRKVAS
jgi:hypothetical protein